MSTVISQGLTGLLLMTQGYAVAAIPTPPAPPSVVITLTSTAVPVINLYDVLEVVPGGRFGGDPAMENLIHRLQNLLVEITGALNTSLVSAIGAGFDGGSEVITAGSDVQVQVPYSGTIVSCVVIGKPDGGSIEIDVLKATYNDYSTLASIVAAAPPSIATDEKSEDVTLSGWNKAVVAGDIFRFVVTSVTGFVEAEISLKVLRQ